MKFGSQPDADGALEILQNKCSQMNRTRVISKKIWCNYDLPIEVRPVNSFLFGLKNTLVEWEFPKKSVKVDLDTAVLKVAGKEILKAKVEGDDFKVEWLNKKWEEWQEFNNSEKYTQIYEKAAEKLAKSRAEIGKGKGKGKGPSM